MQHDTLQQHYPTTQKTSQQGRSHHGMATPGCKLSHTQLSLLRPAHHTILQSAMIQALSAACEARRLSCRWTCCRHATARQSSQQHTRAPSGNTAGRETPRCHTVQGGTLHLAAMPHRAHAPSLDMILVGPFGFCAMLQLLSFTHTRLTNINSIVHQVLLLNRAGCS